MASWIIATCGDSGADPKATQRSHIEVYEQINPWEVLRKYLQGGYYPHQEPETLFAESLAKNEYAAGGGPCLYPPDSPYLPAQAPQAALLGEQAARWDHQCLFTPVT